MKETVSFAGYQVQIKRKAYQSRLGLSVYPNGRILISANKSLSQKQILKFLEEKKSWVETSLKEAKEFRQKYPPKKFEEGEAYPYLGKEYRLKFVESDQFGLKFEEKNLIYFLKSPSQLMDYKNRSLEFKKLKKCYQETAKVLISSRVDIYSRQMRLVPQAVSFRGQKSIWGSCSPENKISLNWKLIVAPLDVIDYVVIHELAHIRHKDHSPRFWKLVEKHVDNLKMCKSWLKKHHYRADFLSKHSELWTEKV